MPLLPLTIESVDYLGADMYAVRIVMADTSTREMIVPKNLATVEAVTFGSVAIAQLLEVATSGTTHHHRGHRRYDPRTG